MAKREIPEVNAGSMADIAFLLLIFFLVTTTMDKDTAYLRTIPQKIKVDKPIELEKKNVLLIKANQDQFFIRGQVFENPDEISDYIIKFYNFNRNRVGEVYNSEFPLYFYTNVVDAERDFNESMEKLNKLKNAGVTSGPKYDVLNDIFTKAEKTFYGLKLYGGPVPTISGEAHVRVEVKESTPYSTFAKIQAEIEEALFTLRDVESKKLFDEGYGSLSRKAESDKGDKELGYKVFLLEFLYPQRIIEVTPKN